MLKARVLTAVLLVAVFLLCLFALPAIGWAGVIAAVLWLAAGEWCRLVSATLFASIVFRVLVVLPVLVFASRDWGRDGIVVTAGTYVAALAFWLFTVSSFLRLKPNLSRGLGRYIIGVMLLVPASLAMYQLRMFSPWMLLGAMAAVWLADIAAFFSGRSFGKRKLAPTISPGKSWEGVIGALVAVVVFALACRVLVPGVSAVLGAGVAVALALLYTMTGVLGDLFESLVKRMAGVKDSGTLLPGHGGVLDRIDSLLPTLPMAALIALWIHYAPPM